MTTMKTKKLSHESLLAKSAAKTLKKKRTELSGAASKEITLAKLHQLKAKYNVSVNGSKKEMAQGLWVIRRTALENKDLQLILSLLKKNYQKEVQQLLAKRIGKKPITNYKGLWEPLPKPINSMPREELIVKLRKFRNAWEKHTKRNQDLEDDRMQEESTAALRKLLRFYYSSSGKLLAEDYLRV
jgi:hypothetical protein